MKEFLVWLWETFNEYINPFVIIHDFERGVRYFCGRNPVLVNPGLRVKCPFIEYIYQVNIRPNTQCPRAVHVTTLDGKTISVEPALEYEIVDAVTWFDGVNDAESNLLDMVRGVASNYISSLNWSDIFKKEGDKIDDEAIKKVEQRIKEILNHKKYCGGMGAKVNKVMLANVCQSRVIITSI